MRLLHSLPGHWVISPARGVCPRSRVLSGFSRESLYKALSEESGPGFDTILEVVGAPGLKLQAEPDLVADSTARQSASNGRSYLARTRQHR